MSYTISIKSEGVGLNGWTLVGGIRLSLQGLNTKSPWTVGFAIQVLEGGVHHNRG